MTEQEIKDAAENHSKDASHASLSPHIIARHSFIAGARFASPKWVPVRESLPNEDSFCPVWSETVHITDGTSTGKGYYHFEWKSWFLMDGYVISDEVTHFMEIYDPPLPSNDQKTEE